MSWVYFIGCMGHDNNIRVKIGFTRRHPTQRRDDFQPGSPEELDVLAYVPGNMALERKLHETFATVRLHNEWFIAIGLLDRLLSRLMREGRGANSPVPYDDFLLAMFEEVYDWAPNPKRPDEDIMLLTETVDTSPWDGDFAHILAERIRLMRERHGV